MSETVQDATTENYVPTFNQNPVEVSWKWFCQYSTTDLCAVDDCFIAKTDPGFSEVEVLGTDHVLQMRQQTDITDVAQCSSENE